MLFVTLDQQIGQCLLLNGLVPSKLSELCECQLPGNSAERFIEIHNAQLKECTKKAPPFGRAMDSADAGFVSDLVDIFEETVNNPLGFISRPFVVAFIEQVAEYSQGMFGLVNTPVD